MKKSYKSGFALPSILIASVVMMAVLAIAMQATSTTRVSLDAQYYNQLAQQAAESGFAMADACLKQNNKIITWSDSKPLQPNTDCNGDIIIACPTTQRDPRCGVIDNDQLRTGFEVGSPTGGGATRNVTVIGKVERFRRSNGATWQAFDSRMSQLTVRQLDLNATRAAHRWWYFGRSAGLDFGTSGTTVTPVNAPCTGICDTGEGTTVAADRSGNLMFWTNGISVWNREGNLMMNGGGLTGNSSTVQAAAFLPLDEDGTRFAVVTNNSESYYYMPGALFYSEIDMTADGGRGAVVGTKNRPLWTGRYASEALNVVPKKDGTGYWVITWRPASTNLIVFEFDKDGLVPGSAKEYSAGTPISSIGNGYAWGSINLNNDYSKIVLMAGYHCTGSTTCPNNAGMMRTLDFDTQTGIPTNRFTWDSGTSLSLVGIGTDGVHRTNTGYSADFSPNGEYVYASILYPGSLYRYKISGATTSAAVKASEEAIAYTNAPSTPARSDGGGQVRRAPNGRMYVANNDASIGAISVINQPDATTTPSMTTAQRQAAIGFIYNGQPLSPGRTSWYGLPQMMPYYTPTSLIY